MNRFKDVLGVEYSAAQPESVEQFNQVIEAYLGSRSNVMELLDAILKQDPEMPMALCFRGYSLKLAADPRFSAPLQKIVELLEKLAPVATAREQAHIEALRCWAGKNSVAATRELENILAEYPKDMLALRIAHYMHFYAGDSTAMRNSVARSAAVWRESDPFYGYLLGMHSFALEESGRYTEAEATGKHAVELNSGDIWAAHAVTHVFQMQRRFAEGIPWVGGLLPAWGQANNFVYHLHWHKALCHIGYGELDAALNIYDRHLADALQDDFYLDVCNAATLLWRLEMLGMNVGDRWQALHELSTARVTDDELVFPTVHYLMTPARLKDQATVDRAIASLEHWSTQDTTQGQLCRDIGLPIAHAIIDFGRGDFDSAAHTLTQIKDDIVKIGGSHAQRDIFNQLMEHATRT